MYMDGYMYVKGLGKLVLMNAEGLVWCLIMVGNEMLNRI